MPQTIQVGCAGVLEEVLAAQKLLAVPSEKDCLQLCHDDSILHTTNLVHNLVSLRDLHHGS